MNRKKRLRVGGRGRCHGHDYRSVCIYHITIVKLPDIPVFSHITGRWLPGLEPGSPAGAGVPLERRAEVSLSLTPPGLAIRRDINAWQRGHRGFIKVLKSAIMPDHLHLEVYVQQRLDLPLGNYIGELKKAMTDDIGRELRERGLPAPPVIFEPNFDDVICSRRGQKDRIYQYIAQNPLRWYVVRNTPGFGRRRIQLSIAGEAREGYGNPFLVRVPELEAVRISRHITPEAFARERDRLMQIVVNGGVLVSPWISPGEKEIRAAAIAAGGSIIHLLANGFGPKYKPGEEDLALCLEGRLLQLAPPEYDRTPAAITKAQCEFLNRLAAVLSGHSPSP